MLKKKWTQLMHDADENLIKNFEFSRRQKNLSVLLRTPIDYRGVEKLIFLVGLWRLGLILNLVIPIKLDSFSIFPYFSSILFLLFYYTGEKLILKLVIDWTVAC